MSLKINEHITQAGYVLGTVLTAGIGPVAYMARKADSDLDHALDTIDIPTAYAQMVHSGPTNIAANERLQQNMDAHAALLFYCAPHIAQKIDDFQTEDGHKLVQQKDDDYIIWDSAEGKKKRLENILSAVDPDSKMQITATLDAENNDAVIHMGGTDFANPQDLLNATTSLTGALNPRTADGIPYTQKALTELMTRYPQLAPDQVNLSFVTHSSGAASLPGGLLAAAAMGFKTDSVIAFAPVGGKTAFDKVEEKTGIDSELLQKNVTSVYATNKGVLDIFKQATASVGQKVVSKTIDGHMGRAIVKGYNRKSSMTK